MSEIPLRRVLMIDAAVGLIVAVTLLVSTALYSELTGLADELLRWAALVLFAYVAALLLAAGLRPLRHGLVVGLIIASGAWVVASVVVLALVATTAFGAFYVLAQALVVVGFAVAEGVLLRRVQD